MKKIKFLPIFVILGILLSFSQLKAEEVDPDVIYGEDNRRDLYKVEVFEHVLWAQSTVALISNSDIEMDPEGDHKILTSSYAEAYGLCEEEPFYSQEIVAYCSGFLVAKDIIVTAGHCITDIESCEETSFVFGFSVDEEDELPSIINSQNIFHCKRLIHSEEEESDFAVIQLDREVEHTLPLLLREEGEIEVGEGLVVIGHPAGLPTKVAAGAKVRSLDDGLFIADLDTYGGNSGSAVFNLESGDVEGILVFGELDYISKGDCSVSNRCAQDECSGEGVTSISNVLPYLGGD